MSGDVIPLTEVLLALTLEEGKSLMRALRLGATITCHRSPWPDGPRYVLRGQVAAASVTTGEHRALGGALLVDLTARLKPHLSRRAEGDGLRSMR